MQDRTKLGAAVVGGYILGRTKKGGAALRLATWLSGNTTGPRVVNMARQGVTTVMASEQAQEITKQLRGPIMAAIQQAAMDAAMARVTRLSDNLVARTQALSTPEGVTEAASGAAHKASDTAKSITDKATDVTKGVTGKVRSKSKSKDDADSTPEAEEAEKDTTSDEADQDESAETETETEPDQDQESSDTGEESESEDSAKTKSSDE